MTIWLITSTQYFCVAELQLDSLHRESGPGTVRQQWTASSSLCNADLHLFWESSLCLQAWKLREHTSSALPLVSPQLCARQQAMHIGAQTNSGPSSQIWHTVCDNCSHRPRVTMLLENAMTDATRRHDKVCKVSPKLAVAWELLEIVLENALRFRPRSAFFPCLHAGNIFPSPSWPD